MDGDFGSKGCISSGSHSTRASKVSMAPDNLWIYSVIIWPVHGTVYLYENSAIGCSSPAEQRSLLGCISTISFFSALRERTTYKICHYFCISYHWWVSFLTTKKSQFTPTQVCRYLGFIFNSRSQSITIPSKRCNNPLQMISSFSKQSKCRIRDFTSMIGSLISVWSVVQYEILYTKKFERKKYIVLSSFEENYNCKMNISLAQEFQWWIRIFSDPNQFNVIRPGRPIRQIYSDASLSGWRASCDARHTHEWCIRKRKS